MINESVSDWVAKVFIKNHIDRVFLYTGGTIVPLINSCIKYGIKIDSFKNEQGAGYAALAYSRITGRPQVAMVTSGPGVTNIMTVIADAFYDSCPLIVITGQIGTQDLNQRSDVRQRGFQETPTVKITAPISKFATILDTQDKVLKSIPEAFSLSKSDRKGPIVLDFPMDIQRSEFTSTEQKQAVNNNDLIAKDHKSSNLELIKDDILDQLKNTSRPLILLGNGANSIAKYNDLDTIIKQLNALVVSSFLGVGSYDSTLENYLGYIGHTGHYAANHAVNECDFLIVLGSRLDVRQTGTEVKRFVENGSVLWVDCDSSELDNSRVDVDWKILDYVDNFLPKFSDLIKGVNIQIDEKWREKILDLKQERNDDCPYNNSSFLQPRNVLDELETHTKDMETIVVTGVGLHQHWAARHLSFIPNKKLLISSGGHGAMGFDLPSAIGAAMSSPEKLILCVVGDGSILMNIQELLTLNERNLNVKIIVLNNNRLGMVSQFQLITFGDDPTTGDLFSTNFQNIAAGFGINSESVRSEKDLKNKISWLISQEGPALLEAKIDPFADVVPMLLAGKSMGDLWMGRDGE